MFNGTAVVIQMWEEGQKNNTVKTYDQWKFFHIIVEKKDHWRNCKGDKWNRKEHNMNYTKVNYVTLL